MKRSTLAVLAGLTAAAGTITAAASLGGLTSESLGADNTVVASCDTDGVSLEYAASYDATAGEYLVDSVTVDGINAACAGLDISVTLASASASLEELTGTIAGTDVTLNTAGVVAADAVTAAAVVIAG